MDLSMYLPRIQIDKKGTNKNIPRRIPNLGGLKLQRFEKEKEQRTDRGARKENVRKGNKKSHSR